MTLSKNENTQRIVLPVPAPPRRWPHLIVIEGPGVGSVYRLLKPDNTIGRDSDADIRLSSETVSRRHAAITVIGGEVAIEDLGSHNGTFVEGQVLLDQRILRDGDHVVLGNVTLLKLTYAVARDVAVRRAGFESASRDPAAALANTQYFIDRLRGEHAYARRHRTPLAMVFFRVGKVGVDDDERNESIVAEDEAMIEVGRILQQTVRAEDLLARVGNSELVALLRSNDEQAVRMAERVRSRVFDETGKPERPASAPAVTLTAAVVSIAETGSIAPETILVAAHDQARMAFAQGTNRVLLRAALRIDPDLGKDEDGGRS
jgi:two-component system cell cycle response regulator